MRLSTIDAIASHDGEPLGPNLSMILINATVLTPTMSDSSPSQQPAPPKPRVTWVDVAKGISILLVVLYHVWNALNNRSDRVIIPAVWADVIDPVLTFVRMPLFFFVSGLFIGKSVQKNAWPFIKDKLAGIAYPYVLWTIIHATIMIGLSGVIHAKSEITFRQLPYLLAIKPYAQYWFLYVLFLALMLYLLLTKLKIPSLAIALFAVLFFYFGDRALLAMHLTWYGPAYQLRTFFVYMALGSIFSPWILSQGHRLPTYSLVALVIFPMGALFAAVSYQLTRDAGLGPMLALGGVASLLSLAILLDRFKLASVFRACGARSLPIFVAHVIALAAMRSLLFKLGVTDFYTHLVASFLAGVVLPYLFAMLVDHLRLRYVFTAR